MSSDSRTSIISRFTSVTFRVVSPVAETHHSDSRQYQWEIRGHSFLLTNPLVTVSALSKLPTLLRTTMAFLHSCTRTLLLTTLSIIAKSSLFVTVTSPLTMTLLNKQDRPSTFISSTSRGTSAVPAITPFAQVLTGIAAPDAPTDKQYRDI